jgi:hypothetical protein
MNNKTKRKEKGPGGFMRLWLPTHITNGDKSKVHGMERAYMRADGVGFCEPVCTPKYKENNHTAFF